MFSLVVYDSETSTPQPEGTVEKPKNRSAPACWCGFSQKLSNWDTSTSKFQKNRKSKLLHSKSTFSTHPLA